VQERELWDGIQTGIWGTTSICCKLGVRSTAALTTIATLDRLTNHRARGVIHVSSGIGACALERSSEISTLRSECEAAGGYLSVLQAPEDLKRSIDMWGYRGNAVTLMRAIEQQFDPDRILNPARCF
jgi:glycolate oxidase FAD binding subunit